MNAVPRSSNLFGLSGKVAWVTGATRGIGRAIAAELARHVAAVVISSDERLQRREGKSLGRLVSDLLALALATQQRSSQPAAPAFKWIARSMHARVDLADKHALRSRMT
jgi:NAD(P)-dependent dehydrogenase (short-subunit alcohol dehydrogenase family)